MSPAGITGVEEPFATWSMLQRRLQHDRRCRSMPLQHRSQCGSTSGDACSTGTNGDRRRSFLESETAMGGDWGRKRERERERGSRCCCFKGGGNRGVGLLQGTSWRGRQETRAIGAPWLASGRDSGQQGKGLRGRRRDYFWEEKKMRLRTRMWDHRGTWRTVEAAECARVINRLNVSVSLKGIT